MLPNSEQTLKLFCATSCSKNACAACVYDGVNTGLGRMPVVSALRVGDGKRGGCGLEKG